MWANNTLAFAQYHLLYQRFPEELLLDSGQSELLTVLIGIMVAARSKWGKTSTILSEVFRAL